MSARETAERAGQDVAAGHMPGPAAARTPVALLLAISSGSRFLFGVVLKPVSEEFGWRRGDLGKVVTLSYVCLSLLQPVIGWAVDRWGSRRILLLGVAATALMTLPLTFAT